MPGLFHAKMADIHGVLISDWGQPSAAARNPGSLVFHNSVIERKPIVITSFRTCRDLIFISLYARILHCLLLVSKKGSLDDYSKDVTWEELVSDAEAIATQYASSDVVAALRWCRRTVNDQEQESSSAKEGDMIFENAVLFLRDSLLSREFTDAVKAGDSGRIVLVPETWAVSFRGSRRTKYAHEMLPFVVRLGSFFTVKLAYCALKIGFE
ncbi:hypothetical protein B0H34DRAFT_128605 [Crassisporium funariophilum]|nr:hypothetical protein B0H34DRAFT_128605 [Crassisporium funariophilum]